MTKKVIVAVISAFIISALSFFASYAVHSLAWASDIQKLSRTQAEQAVDVYSKARRDELISLEAAKEPQTKARIDQRLEEYNAKLKQARDRLIELAK